MVRVSLCEGETSRGINRQSRPEDPRPRCRREDARSIDSLQMIHSGSAVKRRGGVRGVLTSNRMNFRSVIVIGMPISGQRLRAGSFSAVPRAQVVDGDRDDLRRPVRTQRRIVPQELVRHLLWTEALVHQGSHIQALIRRHRVTAGVPEAGRSDICHERTHTAARSRLRSRPLEASRWRIGVRVRDGNQSCDRQDGGTNCPNLSRRADSVETTSPGRPDGTSTHCHIHGPLARNDVVNFRPVILRPAENSRRRPVKSLGISKSQALTPGHARVSRVAATLSSAELPNSADGAFPDRPDTPARSRS